MRQLSTRVQMTAFKQIYDTVLPSTMNTPIHLSQHGQNVKQFKHKKKDDKKHL